MYRLRIRLRDKAASSKRMELGGEDQLRGPGHEVVYTSACRSCVWAREDGRRHRASQKAEDERLGWGNCAC